MIKDIFGLGKIIIQGKQRVKEAEVQAKVNRMSHEDSWENIMADASRNSWKDEWITILFSMPVIMAFFPGMVPYVAAGFDVLNQMPDWFKVGWGVIISASFGIRKINELRIK